MIDTYELLNDMLSAKRNRDYNGKYYIKLIYKDVVNPFRGWFYYRGEYIGSRITLKDYPIYTNMPVDNVIEVVFDKPPVCPQHTWSFHPNIFDNGKVCFGSETRFLPNTTIIGILQLIHQLLNRPNHGERGDVPVPDRCEVRR